MSAPASPSGSRASTEPSSTVSALTGFDPSRGEFTPGPWEARLYHVHVEGKGTVASVPNPWNDKDERQANTRLIATAPELYRELNTLARIAQNFIESNPTRTAKARIACTLLYAAIDNADATLARARDVASAIEARSDAAPQSDAAEGESAAPAGGDAQ